MRRYRLSVGDQAFVLDVKQLGADHFEVVVGDNSYEVTLTGDEDMPRATITPGFSPPLGTRADDDSTSGGATHAARPTAAPLQSTSPAAPPMTGRPAPGGGSSASVSAPMPGLILEVHVKAGDVVQRGQHIAVLDAMKMHNFICAPRAGTVTEVCVSPGQAVGHGDAIVRFAAAG
jgi:glutaconyl-CoA/methylmalonyl-CoA decarboxylase subunit gamma